MSIAALEEILDVNNLKSCMSTVESLVWNCGPSTGALAPFASCLVRLDGARRTGGYDVV